MEPDTISDLPDACLEFTAAIVSERARNKQTWGRARFF